MPHARRNNTVALRAGVQCLLFLACASPEQNRDRATQAGATPSISSGAFAEYAIRDTIAECAACAIELTPLVSLGSESDSVLLTRTPVIARDSRGRTIAAVRDNGFEPVIVYRADGTIERTLGRHGSGPGEHERVEAIAVTEGDSVVLAHSYRRVSVFAPDGRYVRGGTLPSAPRAILYATNGDLIINASLAAGENAALPLHVVGADGMLLRSFGTEDIFGGGTSERTLAPRLDGQWFWLSESGQYRLERSDTLGRVSRVVTVATPWWYVFNSTAEVQAFFDSLPAPDEIPSGAEKRPRRLRYRPPFRIASVVPDAAGKLWVAHHTHVDNWEVLEAEYDRSSSDVRLADEMNGRMYRTVLDVIDPEQGVLIARRIIPGYGWIANDGTFIHVRYRDDGIVALDISSLALSGWPQGWRCCRYTCTASTVPRARLRSAANAIR